MENATKIARVRLEKTWTGNILTATYVGFDVDGKKVGPVEGIAPLTFDIQNLSAENRDHAARHGIEQKIGDAAALPRDTKSGKSASLAEKRELMEEVINRLSKPDGEWNLKGTRGPVNEATLVAKLMALGYDVSKKSGPAVDVTPKG